MAETQTLHDQAGNAYTFHVHPFGTNYKSEGGVYVFAKLANGRWTILYVGETENLRDRLTTNLVHHHRIDCARRSGATHVLSRLVPGGKVARVDLETKLRAKYSPTCNRQSVPA